MKCIKDTKGNVTRVTDKVAAVVVKNGQATYVAKSEWKATGRSKGLLMRKPKEANEVNPS